MPLSIYNTNSSLKDLSNGFHIGPKLMSLNMVQHLSSELIQNVYVVNMSNPPGPGKET